MNTRVTHSRLGISAGAAALALALAGCGGDGGTVQDAKPAAASASPSAQRALALADDVASTEAGQEITVEALANDLVTLEDGTDAALLDTYEPAGFTLAAESPTPHGRSRPRAPRSCTPRRRDSPARTSSRTRSR